MVPETNPDRNLYAIDHLRANGYRCFEALEIQFDSSLTVIAAENAGGKTAILELVAASLWPLVSAFQKSSGNLSHGDVRKVPKNAGTRELWPTGVEVTAAFWIPESDLPPHPGFRLTKSIEWSRSLKAAESARTVLRDDGFIDRFAKQIRKDLIGQGRQEFSLPIVAYYGTGRLWKTLKVTESRKGSGSQTEGYRDCLDSGSGYKLFLEWFRKMAYGVAQRSQVLEAHERPFTESDPAGWLQFVSQQIAKVLEPQVGVRGVRYDIVEEAFLADLRGDGWLEVNQLSDGVRAMLALVGDIAYRIAQLNAHLPAEQLADVPGIVLIDEVDLHLHPTWQQTVLGSLRSAFPNIQWIVTTHSPQVLSTVPKHQIRVLEWEGAKAKAVEPDIPQTQGIESSEILSQVMGTNPTPPVEWAKDLADYRAMVSQGQGTSKDALALRARLETHYGAGNQVFQASDVILAWRARQGL